MRMVMDGIPPTIGLFFLDDVLAHEKTFETHLLALDKVLAAHGKAGGLKAQARKMQHVSCSSGIPRERGVG